MSRKYAMLQLNYFKRAMKETPGFDVLARIGAVLIAFCFFVSLTEFMTSGSDAAQPTYVNGSLYLDPAVAAVLEHPVSSQTARTTHVRQSAIMVAIGHRQDVVGPDICRVSTQGSYEELGGYDLNADGVIDQMIVDYIAPAHSFGGEGECKTGMVFLESATLFG